MLLLLRFVFLALIIFLIYTSVKYLLHPKRKLELAHEQKKYFLLDDPGDIRKNFLLTYKGVLFEGEKYMGTTESAFDIVSIFVWPKNPAALRGLAKEDFHTIEKNIREAYPHSSIDWKSPIKELLQEKE